MNKRLMILPFLLFLTACLYSERPDIAASELAAPRDLEGKYWRVVPHEIQPFSNIMTRTAISEWHFDEARTGFVMTASNEESDKDRFIQLVDLTGSEDYLAIIGLKKDEYETAAASDDDVTYYLLERLDQGILRLSGIGYEPGGLTKDYFWTTLQDRNFLPGGGGKVTAEFKGDLDGTRIPDLFRDPVFFGALTFEVRAYYLPIQGNHVGTPPSGQWNTSVEYDLSDPEWLEILGVNGNSHLPAGQTAELETRPVTYKAHDFTLENWGVTDTRLAPFFDDSFLNSDGGISLTHDQDGSYRISAYGSTVSFQLVSISPKDDPDWFGPEYVAVLTKEPKAAESATATEQQSEVDAPRVEMIVAPPSPAISLLSVSGDGCLEFSPVAVRRRKNSPELERLRFGMMDEAAKRHGMHFGSEGLSGNIDGSNLAALFQDGQFVSGLNESEHEYHETYVFCPTDLEGPGVGRLKMGSRLRF